MNDLGSASRRSGPPRLATGVRVVKLLALLVLVTGAVALGLRDGGASGGAPSADRRTTAVERVVADTALARCSHHGVAPAPSGAPSSEQGSEQGHVVALVRGPQGVVRPVPFARGWQVFRGELPGTLVAVCRGSRT